MMLHLIRHAETRENAEGRIQGHKIDGPLNDVGIAQAQALARHYAREATDGHRIAVVYTSPLRRAVATAKAIAARAEVTDPVVDARLREIDWGHHSGKLNVGPTRADMDRILQAWDEGDLSARALGGEAPANAWERASAAVSEIIERHGNETIIVVAHGRIIKILMSGLLHGHLHHMERYPQANTGATILEGPHPWRLRVSNQIAHLRGLRAREERAS